MDVRSAQCMGVGGVARKHVYEQVNLNNAWIMERMAEAQKEGAICKLGVVWGKAKRWVSKGDTQDRGTWNGGMKGARKRGCNQHEAKLHGYKGSPSFISVSLHLSVSETGRKRDLMVVSQGLNDQKQRKLLRWWGLHSQQSVKDYLRHTFIYLYMCMSVWVNAMCM